MRVCSSSSSTRLFPNDFTTKAWSPLLDGDPPAQGVYHIPAPQPSAHTHTLAWTHAILLGTRRAARKSRGNNYSSLLFLSLPRQPHETAFQPSRPPQVQVSVPTQTLLVYMKRCGAAGSLGSQAWTLPLAKKKFVLWVRYDWRHIQTSHSATCRAAATGRIETEEEADEQTKRKGCGELLVSPVKSYLGEWLLYGNCGDIIYPETSFQRNT